jgi:hypothetical protein
MNVVTTLPGSCAVFEPLRTQAQPGLDQIINEFAPRIESQVDMPELEAYLRKVFCGHLLTRWSSNYASLMQLIRARRFVVKLVRANRMMGWMQANFPDVRRIIMLRHPCAVVSSMRRARADWTDWTADDVLRPLRRMFGMRAEALLCANSTQEELLAAAWAADTYAVVTETNPQDTLLLTYEEVLADPSSALHRIFEYLDEPVPAGAAAAVRRASETSNVDSAILRNEDLISAWKKRMSSATAQQILRITHDLGIHFYELDPEPDLRLLRQVHGGRMGSDGLLAPVTPLS